MIEASLKDEPHIVTDLGMTYIHIPVHFWNPTKDDFNKFTKAMGTSDGKKAWVHCAAGMRASAFLYKYRCTVLRADKETALWDLSEIWEPFENWKNSPLVMSKKNHVTPYCKIITVLYVVRKSVVHH